MSGALVCPYCRSPLLPAMKAERCDRCSAVYHSECWKEYGRCGVFGCNGQPLHTTHRALLFVPALFWLLCQLHNAVAASFMSLLVPAMAYCWAATFYYLKHLYWDLRNPAVGMHRAQHDLLLLLTNACPVLYAIIP
jgi:hypothetical protein